MNPDDRKPPHRWIWPTLIVLFVVNVSVLIALWMTEMPDMSTLPGQAPQHELKPYKEKK